MQGVGVVLALVASLAIAGPGLSAEPRLTHAQARKAIEHIDAGTRLAGVERLAAVGSMADADRLVARLADDDPVVRELAAAAMWKIWSRSGDRAIDALFERGVAQMQESKLEQALATFSEIIRRRPAFAEGWNKRATVLFMLGQNQQSLRDCHEVLKRNPNHFGALTGAAQINLNLGNPEAAIDYFERALRVNPGLSGVARAIEILERRQQDRRDRTI
jgi:tetratricopeptide (TPR) repeat protein